MTRRPVSVIALAALALGGVVATQANAAAKPKPKPKPVCNLVKDDEGDATGFLLVSGVLPDAPGLDLLSADIATSAKNIAAVFRVKDLAAGAGTIPGGRSFYLNFNVGSTAYFMEASDDNTGGLGDSSSGLRSTFSKGTVVFDNAKNTVTVTAPLADLVKKEKSVVPGSKFTAINALAQRSVNLVAVGITPTADDTANGMDYVVGSPSCVKP